MSRIDRFSRRALLKGLGVGPALLPLLEVERAYACAAVSGPKRMFILVWPDGMIAKTASSWATTGPTWALPAHMAALEPYKADLLLLDGLDYKFISDSPNKEGGEVSGHACFQGMLTGKWYQSFGSSTANNIAGGISIDQHIGNKLKASGYGGIPTLNLQAFSRSTARLSWVAGGSGQDVAPDYDPWHVFSMVFAGVKPAPPPAPGMPAALTAADKAMLMRKSILDSVSSDLTRFSASVGSEDRVRIDSHLTFVRDIETQIQGAMGGAGGTGGGMVIRPTTGACQPPTMGTALLGKALQAAANFPAITKLMIDISVAAFAADATRVVVLQLGDQANPDVVLSELGFSVGGQSGNTGDINGWHAIAHRNAAEKVKVDAWAMGRVAYAVGSMKNITDGAGSMLDNTAFVAMSNMRTGIHEFTGVPAIIAGSCGGYFKTGRSLKLTNTPNNGLLCALGNAMLGAGSTPTFGETMYGGELAALKG